MLLPNKLTVLLIRCPCIIFFPISCLKTPRILFLYAVCLLILVYVCFHSIGYIILQHFCYFNCWIHISFITCLAFNNIYILLLSLLLLLLSLPLSPLYRVFTRMSPRQTVSLVDTLLQLFFRFIVNTVSGAYLTRSYVGSDGLLRQHFPENVCSA